MWNAIFGIIVLLSLQACQTTQLPIVFKTSSSVNAVHGKGQYLYIKIYELTSAKRFLQSNSTELWRDDIAQLGQSLIKQHAFMLHPNQHTQKYISLDHRTRWLCLIGFFRLIHNWQHQQCILINTSHRFWRKPIEIVGTTSQIVFGNPDSCQVKSPQKIVDNTNE